MLLLAYHSKQFAIFQKKKRIFYGDSMEANRGIGTMLCTFLLIAPVFMKWSEPECKLELTVFV